jgi:hypothetical protein
MRRSLPLLLCLVAALVCASPALAGKAKTTATKTTTTMATTTTTTASAPAQLFGFNDNAVAFGQLTAAADATLAKSAGATVSRVTFDWRWAEPTQGNWKLSQYDAIYKPTSPRASSRSSSWRSRRSGPGPTRATAPRSPSRAATRRAPPTSTHGALS